MKEIDQHDTLEIVKIFLNSKLIVKWQTLFLNANVFRIVFEYSQNTKIRQIYLLNTNAYVQP